MTDTSRLFEIAVAKARFTKASKLADLLMDEGIETDDLDHMTDEAWDIACQISSVREASLVTRQLVECIMRDREEQKSRG